MVKLWQTPTGVFFVGGDELDLKTIKQRCLQKINEYSNNGAKNSDAQNADYLLRMNGYINDVQLSIARVRKLSAQFTLGTPDVVTDLYNKYNMPTNFMELKGITFNEIPFHQVLWDNKTVSIGKDYAGTFTVSYYKYPIEITDDTPDTTLLEVDLDAQTVIPYYVGGYVLFDENPMVGTQLINQYEVLLSRLGGTPEYGIRQIPIVYGM